MPTGEVINIDRGSYLTIIIYRLCVSTDLIFNQSAIFDKLIMFTSIDIPKPNRVWSPTKFFVERDEEINTVVSLLAAEQGNHISGRKCIIYGSSGIGKTELCRVAAQKLRSEYPDAQIYIRVDDNDPGHVALFKIIETIIHIFEPERPVLDDLSTMTDQYVSALSGKRALIILDGLQSGEFLDLLTRPTLCGLLITTNQKLESLSRETVNLNELSQKAAEEVLTRICPRLDARVADLAKICQNIPANLCLMAGYANYETAIKIDDLVSPFRKRTKGEVEQSSNRTEGIVSFVLNRMTTIQRDFFLRLSILSSGFDLALAKEAYSADSNEDVSLDMIQAHLHNFIKMNLLTYNQELDYYWMPSAVQNYALNSLGAASEVWYGLGTAFADSMKWFNSFANEGSDEYFLSLSILDDRKATIKRILQYLLGQASVDRDRILLKFHDLLRSPGKSRFAPRFEQVPLLEAMLDTAIRLQDSDKLDAIFENLFPLCEALGEKEKSLYYSKLKSEALRRRSKALDEKTPDEMFEVGQDDELASGGTAKVESSSARSELGDLLPNEARVILTGFMGTGKTTVGKLLAEHLNYRFIDTDELIESRHNRSISDIFQELGEDAFRKMERSIVKELANLDRVVISTGGRLMLDPENALALSHNSRVLCLVAMPDEILARVKSDKTHERPLLEVSNPKERIVELLQERRDDYLRFPQVLTDEKKPADIAKGLVEFVNTNPKSLIIENPQKDYEYIVGAGLLPFLRQLTGIQEEVVIITDQDVKKLYGPSCASIGTILEIPSDLQHKSIATVQSLYSQLLDQGFDRNGTIMALGGSLVGDIAGYVAGTYMRGVNFIQCPTSLMAMVDTSIGGKASIDLLEGKNLIGVYKQPAKIIADVATLQTLPQPDFASGMAEIIKHGLIAESSLLDQIEQRHWDKHWDRTPNYIGELQKLVAQAIQVKINIVQADPFEKGVRSILNLGHTFAYGIEQLSNNAYRHGEAVSMGLVAAVNLSVRLGFCDISLQKRLEIILQSVSLPIRIPSQIKPEALLQAMQSDKKKQDGQLRFILIRGIGQAFISNQVSNHEVLDTISSLST